MAEIDFERNSPFYGHFLSDDFRKHVELIDAELDLALKGTEFETIKMSPVVQVMMVRIAILEAVIKRLMNINDMNSPLANQQQLTQVNTNTLIGPGSGYLNKP